MSIFTSLYTGWSGLDAHGEAISVVGDDIANASTIGFKESRAQFSDVIGGTAANGQKMGNGVRMSGTETLFGQGSLQNTGRSLDLAISGNGFFVVHGNHGGQSGDYYSRDGRFSLDKSGTVINSEGLALQGYAIDATGKMSTTQADLKIGGESPASPTTSATMGVNLDSASVTPAAFSAANPAGTSNYSTSTTVYDSLGASHRVDVYFRNQGGGNWEYHAMVDGGELTGGTAGVPTEIAGGTLNYNTNGALNSVTPGASSASFLNATANQAITFNFGDPIAAGGTGLAGSTQFSEPSSVKSSTQDGYAAGNLTDVAIGDDGTITGKFSNGQSRPVARLALATFAAEEGLQRAGGQLFAATPKSGAALVDAAGVGNRGAISSGALEESNVDLSAELVTLIAYQRAFSANSKTIQTADEMLQEINTLKR
jgi:flagellar hook protein FlgE